MTATVQRLSVPLAWYAGFVRAFGNVLFAVSLFIVYWTLGR